MTRLKVIGVLAVTLCAPAARAFAQNVSPLSPTASMADTKVWLERDFAAIVNDAHVQTQAQGSGQRIEMTSRFRVDNVTFDECRFSWRSSIQLNTDPPRVSTSTVTLRDLDLDSLQARVASAPSGAWTENKRNVTLVFRALRSSDEPFIYSDVRLNERTDLVSVHARDTAAANLAIAALRRASTLCTTASAAPAGGMTNATVIELTAAKLSAVVISTSIRQAKTKQFDLSPAGLIALKKASVSDTVILAMQAPDAPTNGRPLTSARARRDSIAAANDAFLASVPGKYFKDGNAGDFVELMQDGTFVLKDGRRTYQGRYAMRGTGLATFTSVGASGSYLSSATGKTIRVLAAGDSVFQCQGGPGCRYIPVTSTTISDPQGEAFWSKVPVQSAGGGANGQSNTNGSQLASSCKDIDYLGVVLAVQGGGMMAGRNAYGAQVRNRASYTMELDFTWTMNGRAETGTFRVAAGEFTKVNLGQGSSPPTNVRLIACR